MEPHKRLSSHGPNLETPFPYPGIPATEDGTSMVVWVESAITQAACAYPITSSTNMGVEYQRLVANGLQNLWGEPVSFLQSESEHSSASACEGYALAGGRVTNFTSGQGLILMKEVLYTIAGKRLGVVFNIGSRALSSQSLNIHAGHDDVMACADVGWGMLFAKNAQEAADLALIARRTAEETATPFMSVQDGFLTTHTVERVLKPEAEFMAQFVGHPNSKILNLFDTNRPVMSGPVQNQDSYMIGKIAQRVFYDRIPEVLRDSMNEFYLQTGRSYDFVEKYRMDDASYAIVGLGTLTETAMASADYMRKSMGILVGVLSITAFRPFPGPQIVEALKSTQAFSVVERLDVPLAQSNPLTTEVKAAFMDAFIGSEGYTQIHRLPKIFSGSAGLGGRDIKARDFIAAVKNMATDNPNGKEFFVLGIQHPLALSVNVDPDINPPDSFAMRGHSVGGYGAVATLKVIATIIGDVFGLHVQAMPKYGSEKRGLPTNTYLTISSERVRGHHELQDVDFVTLANTNAFEVGDPLEGLRQGGMLFLQTEESHPEDIFASLPLFARTIIRQRNIRVLGLDAQKIAEQEAPSVDLAQRMQGIVLLGVFLRCTPFQGILHLTDAQVWNGVTDALRHYFGPRRGEQLVQDNLRIARRGYTEVMEVPRALIEASSSL